MLFNGPYRGPYSATEAALLNAEFRSGSLPFGVTFSRSGSATFLDDAGVWQEVAADVPIFTREGLAIQPAGTNGLRNPRCEGATVGVLGAGGAFPTHWGFDTPAGLTAEVLSVQEVDGVDTITIRFSGTTTGTSLFMTFDTSTGIVTTPSSPVAFGVFIRMDAKVAPVSDISFRLRMTSRTAAGGAIAGGFFNQQFGPPLVLTRQILTGNMSSNVNTARAWPTFEIPLLNATAYDFTVTFGWPTVEFSDATTPILPPVGTPGASSRGATLVSMALPASPRGYIVEWSGAGGDAGTEQTCWQIDDGTADNAVAAFITTAGNVARVRRTTATVPAETADLGAVASGAVFGMAASASAGEVIASLRGQPAQTVSGAPTSFSTLRLGGGVGGVPYLRGVVSSAVVRRA